MCICTIGIGIIGLMVAFTFENGGKISVNGGKCTFCFLLVAMGVFGISPLFI